MSFYEDASLIVLADGAYDSGIKAFKPVLNDSDPSDPNYLVPSGVGDFTVDRNSVATRVNADGLIEEVAVNVPRLDYLNGSCPELLVEPQSTNLVTYSEDFSDASWLKANCVVSSNNSIISPDGANNSFTITEDATVNSQHGLQSIFINSSGSVTCSVIAKYKGRNLGFRNFDSGVDIRVTKFDLENGVVFSTDSGTTASITPLANDWYLCTQTYESAGALTNFRLQIRTLDDNFDIQYDGDGVSGLYIWSTQIEELPYPTSYIKTEGFGVETRLADDLSGSGDSSTFNDSEGVLFIEALSLTDTPDSDRIVRIKNSSDPNNEYIDFRFDTVTNRVQNVVRTGGANQYTSGYITPDTTVQNKFAFKYKENDFALWFNGVEVVTGSSGSTPSGLDELFLYSGFGGRFKQILYFNSALSDSELQSLTL